MVLAEELVVLPGQFWFPRRSARVRSQSFSSTRTAPPQYHVHGGMPRMTCVMGRLGRAVHVAVCEALEHNPEYSTCPVCVCECG